MIGNKVGVRGALIGLGCLFFISNELVVFGKVINCWILPKQRNCMNDPYQRSKWCFYIKDYTLHTKFICCHLLYYMDKHMATPTLFAGDKTWHNILAQLHSHLKIQLLYVCLHAYVCINHTYVGLKELINNENSCPLFSLFLSWAAD